jgi:hypothetical protein
LGTVTPPLAPVPKIVFWPVGGLAQMSRPLPRLAALFRSDDQ